MTQKQTIQLTNAIRRERLELVVHYDRTRGYRIVGHQTPVVDDIRIGKTSDEAHDWLFGTTENINLPYNHGINILKEKYPERVMTFRLAPIV